MRQVKEKFGGLRFYWSLKGQSDIRLDVMGMPGGSFTVLPEGDTSPLFEAIRARVRRAEQHSLTICQDCSDGAMLDESSQGYAVLCMCCRGARRAWGERVKLEPQPPGSYRVYPSPVRVVETVVTPQPRGAAQLVVEDAGRRRYVLSKNVRLIEIDQLRTGDRVICTVLGVTGDAVVSAALVR